MPETIAFQAMSEIKAGQDAEMVDPKLRGLAKRILNEFELAAQKAVAHLAEPSTYKLPTDSKAVEHLLVARLKSLSNVKQELARLKVMKVVKSPLDVRRKYLGDLGNIDLATGISVQKQVITVPIPNTLKLTAMNVDGLMLAPTGLSPQQVFTKLNLRLHRVTCVDETDPEWGGSDKIALAGATVGPSGAVSQVPEFTVGNFDDGDVKSFHPPNFKLLRQFSLLEGGSAWPKTYFATLVLAEKDNGGFPTFILTLLNAIRDRVAVVVASAAGSAIGGSLAGPIGAAIGAAVGWILGRFIQWLIDWWNDDVFPPRTVSVTIPSISHRWPGNKLDSPDFFVWFTGHGGIYKLTYDWRMLS